MDTVLGLLSLTFAGLFYWACSRLSKGISKRYGRLSLGLMLLVSICSAAPGWAFLVLNEGREITLLGAAVVIGTLWTTAASPYLLAFFLISLGSAPGEPGDAPEKAA